MAKVYPRLSDEEIVKMLKSTKLTGLNQLKGLVADQEDPYPELDDPESELSPARSVEQGVKKRKKVTRG